MSTPLSITDDPTVASVLPFTDLQLALTDIQYHFVEAKVRGYEAKLNRKGELERYVTLTISSGGRWYTIGHNVKGDRLTKIDREITSLHDTWALVAIQGGIIEEEKKDKAGEVIIDQQTGLPLMRYTSWRVLFPSELSTIFQVSQQQRPPTEGEEKKKPSQQPVRKSVAQVQADEEYGAF